MTSSVLAAFLLPLVVSTMAVELPYLCSFEDPGLCGMENGEGGDFNWTRHTENTPSDGTGPDRAADGWWYMYIESSDDEPDKRQRGDKAYIQTPAIKYAGDVCIRFQYHMYGRDIGRLVVLVDTRGENSTAAFTKSRDQNTTWHRATVNVEGFKTGGRVVFTAERGNGHLGDIAIDDLHIANETCHDCQVNNGGCEHICGRQGNWTICSCHEDYSKDGPQCIPVETTSFSPSTSTRSSISASATPGDSRSNADDRRTAYIVGGVLAGVVIVVGVVLLVICVIRKKRSHADENGSSQKKTWFLLPLHFPKRGQKEQVAPLGGDSKPVVTQREPMLSAKLSRLSLTITRIVTAPKPTDFSCQHEMEAASVTSAEPPPELLRKIPGEDFPSYVTGKKSNGALAQEFKGIPYQLHPCSEAVRPMHKTRNRFLNILPYDHNRVTLEQQGEAIESQYINASFIKMYREDEIFIASQGPIYATINDFWRMVWEQDAGLVVMLTKVEEGGKKRKCERYWPEEGSKSYGSFIVENKSTVYWPDFILRTFAVAMRDDPDEWRYVKQLHFISWLDHVVPNDITTLLRFHRRMRRDMVAGKPTVIHCSAGVGRTGTLMAIDYLMDQLQEEGELGVYECVYNLRGERMSMVQSQAQYIFVHDAVAEIVTLGETTIPCATFKDGVSFDKVAKEFQALEQAKPKKINEDTKLALSKVNKKKNRDPSIYPRILKRVPLTSGIKGRNDYINAVTVNSHHKKIAYIATQTPLVDTQIDFWRMIHDYQCRCIVILDSEVEDWLPSDSNKEIAIHQYHLAMTSPETSVSGEVALFDAVLYKGDFNEQTSDIRTLDHRRPTDKAAQPPAEPEPAPAQEPEEKDDGISVTTETDDEPAEVVTHPAETEYMNNAEVSTMKRMEQNAVRFGVIQCPLESYTDLTSSLLSQVFSSVQERQKRWPDSPIVVVSRDGAELCGLAITFFSALEMMREEGEVDLYHVVKQAKECRPEFIGSLAQYKYLHTLMENSIQQCGDYQNAP